MMSDDNSEALHETVNASFTMLGDIKALLQAQQSAQAAPTAASADTSELAAAVQQLRGELQSLRDELTKVQFMERFDYIGDSVRRIGLFLEQYDKIQAELAYLPESLNVILAQMRESIETRLEAHQRETLLADYERRLRETIAQAQAREVILADYDRRLQEVTAQLEVRDQQLAAAYARLGVFRPRPSQSTAPKS